jgi:transcriptional regulator
MGSRYDRIRRHIVPFEATVVEQRAKFKLGQDERDTIYADIVAGVAKSGEDELLAWMRELNPGR